MPHDGDVEIFAASNGELRVRAAEGRVGDQSFKGEHPVAAGADIECGKIRFVLLPWEA